MSRQVVLLACLFLFGCATSHRDAATSLEAEAERVANAIMDETGDLLAQKQGYVWHVADNGMSVQFGVPETDDRALRVDCKDRMISIIAPASTNAAEGSPTIATLSNGERRPGRIVYLGDGPNFIVTLPATDPATESLVTNDRIRINTIESIVSLPGAGGKSYLRLLIDKCRNH